MKAVSLLINLRLHYIEKIPDNYEQAAQHEKTDLQG